MGKIGAFWRSVVRRGLLLPSLMLSNGSNFARSGFLGLWGYSYGGAMGFSRLVGLFMGIGGRGIPTPIIFGL